MLLLKPDGLCLEMWWWVWKPCLCVQVEFVSVFKLQSSDVLLRFTLILSEGPISLWPWTSPKISCLTCSLTLRPETNWSCSPSSASRRATTCPSSNTDQTLRTGSSLTAWPTEKVGFENNKNMKTHDLFLNTFSYLFFLCVCLFRRKWRLQHPYGAALSWGRHVSGNATWWIGQTGASRHEGRGQASLLWRLHVPVPEPQDVPIPLRGGH